MTKASARFMVRLTPEEHVALKEAATNAGLTPAGLASSAIRATLGRPFDPGGALRDAIIENVDQLRRVGVNLNQVARALNEARAVRDEDVHVAVLNLIGVLNDTRANYAALIRSRRSNLHIRSKSAPRAP